MNSFLSSVIRIFRLDKAVLYGLILRVWLAVGGVVSVALIGTCFTPELQGYYYTFASLVALQTFFELGLSVAVVNAASHEGAKLRIEREGKLSGDPVALTRLSDLSTLMLRWYGVAAVFFVIGAGIAGTLFLGRGELPAAVWFWPWWVVVSFAGITLWTQAQLAILDGCGQIAAINKFRLFQAATSYFVLWLGIISGAELWSMALSSVVSNVWLGWLFLVRYRNFFKSLNVLVQEARLSWGRDVWPHQWRLALQGIANYFMFSLFTPVIFEYHGAIAAGQMGLTWQVASGIQAAALVWIQSAVPTLGGLVAKGDKNAVLRIWIHISAVSILICFFGMLTLYCLVLALNMIESVFSSRLLPPSAILILGFAVLASQMIQCMAALCRSHRKEVFAFVGLSTGALAGAAIWWSGKNYGTTGALAGYLFVIAAWALPLTIGMTINLLRNSNYQFKLSLRFFR